MSGEQPKPECMVPDCKEKARWKGICGQCYHQAKTLTLVTEGTTTRRIQAVRRGGLLIRSMAMIKTYVTPGNDFVTEMPHSEVCMYMRIAGEVMRGVLLDREYPMVQLFKDGWPFSAPILTSEAGLYHDEGGYYYYKGA